jgi:ferritin-like metal-binding protein YciE
MKKLTGLRKLLEDQVADMYYAEKQLVKTLGTLARTAGNGRLKEAFAGHLEETKGHVERLERVFNYLGRVPMAKKCPAIDGIIEEGSEIMKDLSDDPPLDAGLIAAGQKAEHYEIATYGFMCEWAKELGLTAVEDLLHETLEEEKAADEKLTGIAESVVNMEGETA